MEIKKMELIKYEAACRAVAEARSIDEAREICGRAEAARAYARQVKNRQLELDAMEIRVRAERRLGEIILDLKKQNIVGQGPRKDTPDGRPITLPELGIDGHISAASQRLASLPEERFNDEVKVWRNDAETASRLRAPLAEYREPHLRAVRQRAKARNKSGQPIEVRDRFGRFIAVDGRRIADWRAGELRRLEETFSRLIACVRELRSEMPVANPDPLATMEMIFDPPRLEVILAAVWDAEAVHCGDAGINEARVVASRERRKRVCEECNCEFIMRSPSGKANRGKSREGRFCSHGCFVTWRRKQSDARS